MQHSKNAISFDCHIFIRIRPFISLVVNVSLLNGKLIKQPSRNGLVFEYRIVIIVSDLFAIFVIVKNLLGFDNFI